MRFHKDGKLPPTDQYWVWVFGSNLGGFHGAGAAKVAREKFGAKPGKGVGRAGNSYAIPTKSYQLRTLTLEAIKPFVNDFIEYAEKHPELNFWVTAVGCGLAGYKHFEIAPIFENSPPNCNLPDTFIPYLVFPHVKM